MSNQQQPIHVKIAYNRTSYLPRNFFLHLHDLPDDVQVEILVQGENKASEVQNNSCEARCYLPNDTPAHVIIRDKEGKLLAGRSYLVHDQRMYEQAIPNSPLIVIQTTQMAGH